VSMKRKNESMTLKSSKLTCFSIRKHLHSNSSREVMLVG
jgi:hypothetical protein